MRSSIVFPLLALVANAAASKIVVGYFPNWLYATYPVANIKFDKYTHINYAFAVLNTATFEPSFTDADAVSRQLPELVKAAHAAKAKVLLSIGGWTGCIKFSPMVASTKGRKAFIDWNIAFVKQYSTDGVDIDWEYPGQQGAGCNEVDLANDAKNFAILLEELRTALDSNFKDHKEITLATRVTPFETPSGPSKDVSKFVASVDHFNLMTYDINGAWANTTGPNSPLNFEKGKGMQASFVQAINDWNAAGVPYSKIVGGLAYYGRAFQATDDADGKSQYIASKLGAPKGDSEDAFWQDPSCSKDAGSLSGIWKYKNLRSEGLLATPTTAGSGWKRYWDDVSQTPYLFNPSSKIFISYDDPTSIKVKVDYALCKDIAGVMVWDIHQDNDELLDAVDGIQGTKPSSCGSSKSSDESSSVGGKTTTTKGASSVSPTPKATSATDPASSKTTITKTKVTTPVTEASSSSDEKTSSPASPTPTAPTGDNPPCTDANNGLSVCKGTGSSPAYSECVNGAWAALSCGPGTVCKTSGTSIVCDFA